MEQLVHVTGFLEDLLNGSMQMAHCFVMFKGVDGNSLSNDIHGSS
jgi:hypothetical protein